MLRILIALSFASIALGQSKPAVVVELFTSEGCSSCPPADALLAKIPQAFPDLEIIPLSEHVDYWNHLGWKDRFSSAQFTERQQDFVRVFHLESAYTPEMVVNGQIQVSGNDPGAVQNAIHKAAEGSKASARLSLPSPGTLHIEITNLPAGAKNADVFLAITESNLESLPDKGENNGARLRHIGVVRSLTNVGHIDLKRSPAFTSDTKLNSNPEWRMQNVQYVVFAQDRSTHRIIGAATLHN